MYSRMMCDSAIEFPLWMNTGTFLENQTVLMKGRVLLVSEDVRIHKGYALLFESYLNSDAVVIGPVPRQLHFTLLH